MNAFLCLSDRDTDFAEWAMPHLYRNFDDVFNFKRDQKACDDWRTQVDKELGQCDVVLVLIGQGETNNSGETVHSLSPGQKKEVEILETIKQGKPDLNIVSCLIEHAQFPADIHSFSSSFLTHYPCIAGVRRSESGAIEAVRHIMEVLDENFIFDGLPTNPLLFSYEKDIINHYITDEALSCFFEAVGLRPDSSRQEVEAQIQSHPSQTADLFEKIGLKPSASVGEQAGQLLGQRAMIQERIFEGCPAKWPTVHKYEDAKRIRALEDEFRKLIEGTNEEEIQAKLQEKLESYESQFGNIRRKDHVVVAAALSRYHGDLECRNNGNCMIRQNIHFPEAGPRDFVYYPSGERYTQGKEELKVGILVSGGIAPGVNAVIDGIVQRHLKYAKEFNYYLKNRDTNGLNPKIYGLFNGFAAFNDPGSIPTKDLVSTYMETSQQASEGGSLLGTSRFDDLLDGRIRTKELEKIVNKLYEQKYDILYIIGGGGSMKAAHALWTTAQTYAKKNHASPLSIVAIPKTMDNDILWVWQTFGFLSAVEKAREIIDHLAIEVTSNPRLCVAQLYGSDSGFVVSHAVLASRPGQCDVALIPEVEFTIRGVAEYLRKKIIERDKPIPYGLVIMAETAIPKDAEKFIELDERIVQECGGNDQRSILGLSEAEKEAIATYRNKRIKGQTPDALRSAGLKLVSRGLKYVLENPDDPRHNPVCPRLVTNEPRHLLRANPPSCTDIIMGNRLGTLAVDNALAGYTDFMISQWLTEYVLVPLELVALGRKRIPKTGIFWKSVTAKTGQPLDLSV